jgi:uncharacterized protein (TIGR02145 family)
MKSIITLAATLTLAITLTLTACEEKKKQDSTDTKATETAGEWWWQKSSQEAVAEKPAENESESQPSGEEDSSKGEPPKTVEAIFLGEGEDHEGRCEVTFRLPNGETLMFTACAHNIKKGDKVSITYTEELDDVKKIGESANIFTDTRDKKIYWTTKIGEQTWMAENLNLEMEGSKCYANYPKYCDEYGRLYDWNAAIKACPSGWHLPSKAEWETFAVAAGLKKKPEASCYAGTAWTGAEKLKADNGFAALLGGSRCAAGGIELGECDEWVGDMGVSGKWWSSYIDEEGGTSNFEITEDEASLCNSMSRYGSGFGYSVRCIKN